MPNTPDRVAATAALIRDMPSADRDALVCSIVSRWPETTSEEIEQALELASALEVELIEDYPPVQLRLGIQRSAPAKALEEVEAIELHAMAGSPRIKAKRSRNLVGQLAIKAPGPLADEARGIAVLRHRTEEVLLVPVPEQIVGPHRKPPVLCPG